MSLLKTALNALASVPDRARKTVTAIRRPAASREAQLRAAGMNRADARKRAKIETSRAYRTDPKRFATTMYMRGYFFADRLPNQRQRRIRTRRAA